MRVEFLEVFGSGCVWIKNTIVFGYTIRTLCGVFIKLNC